MFIYHKYHDFWCQNRVLGAKMVPRNHNFHEKWLIFWLTGNQKVKNSSGRITSKMNFLGFWVSETQKSWFLGAKMVPRNHDFHEKTKKMALLL